MRCLIDFLRRQLFKNLPLLIAAILALTSIDYARVNSAPLNNTSHGTVDLAARGYSRERLLKLCRQDGSILRLHLCNTSLVDSDLSCLFRLKGLRYLDLSDTRISDTGLSK